MAVHLLATALHGVVTAGGHYLPVVQGNQK
jgi:hypothetical protein